MIRLKSFSGAIFFQQSAVHFASQPAPSPLTLSAQPEPLLVFAAQHRLHGESTELHFQHIVCGVDGGLDRDRGL